MREGISLKLVLNVFIIYMKKSKIIYIILILYMFIGVKMVYDIVDNLVGGVWSLGFYGLVYDWLEINFIFFNLVMSLLYIW